jgi:hypothetical protein
MRKLIIALAAVIGIGGVMFAAMPAMAACTPGSGDAVNACATVPSVLSITGLTGAINFGTVNPAQPNTVTGAEAYTVVTNQPTGYVATITGSDSGLSDGTQNIGNQTITVTETGYNAGSYTFSSDESAPLQVGADTGASNDAYAENWTWTPPYNTEPGNFTETFTYAVVAG